MSILSTKAGPKGGSVQTGSTVLGGSVQTGATVLDIKILNIYVQLFFNVCVCVCGGGVVAAGLSGTFDHKANIIVTQVHTLMLTSSFQRLIQGLGFHWTIHHIVLLFHMNRCFKYMVQQSHSYQALLSQSSVCRQNGFHV